MNEGGKGKNEVKIRRGGLGAIWISASSPSCYARFCVTGRPARQTSRPHSRFYLDKAACFDNLNNTSRARDSCHVIRKEPHKQMINEHLAKYSYDPNEVTRWEALNLTSCYGVFPGEHVLSREGYGPGTKPPSADSRQYSWPDTVTLSCRTPYRLLLLKKYSDTSANEWPC